MCRELQNIFLVNKTEIAFGVDRSLDCRHRSKSSEPLFLTSKFLLSESVVNVTISKIYIRHSLFPPTRTAKPIYCL